MSQSSPAVGKIVVTCISCSKEIIIRQTSSKVDIEKQYERIAEANQRKLKQHEAKCVFAYFNFTFQENTDRIKAK